MSHKYKQHIISFAIAFTITLVSTLQGKSSPVAIIANLLTKDCNINMSFITCEDPADLETQFK